MRIVSGYAGGIRLEVPRDDAIRPTEDKVKESLFATLGDLRGLRVLDLYSGTGALGLEALSRGASSVVAVEADRRHAAVIERNRQAVLKAMGRYAEGVRHRLMVCDARSAVRQLQAASFDLILADPPYHAAPGQYGGRELLLDAAAAQTAAPGALLMLEHATETVNLPWAPTEGCRWQLLRERSFGIRTIAFARLTEPSTEEEK